MKLKKIVLLVLCVTLLSGCSFVRINTNSYDTNIYNVLKRKNYKVNTNSVGYQYYLLNGITKKEGNEFNQVLKSSNGIYYMYVDLVSYYHKISKDYNTNDNLYISKKINYKDNIGYLEVSDEKDYYYVKAMYNYSKIEAHINKKKLNDALVEIFYTLSSIKYNDTIVEDILGNDKYDLSENKEYNLFNIDNDDGESNYLEEIKKYDVYDAEEDAQSLIEHEEVNTSIDE
ncbi:MAG: hypothetical protein IKE10_00880 [Bacilli bacterium]|nr:hypothetical protein [Bacilli bacterium]